MSNSDRSAGPTPPWSDPVAVIQIPETGLARDIEANPEQKQGMAALGGILGVDRVRAELLLVPIKGGTIHVTGRVFGRLTQSCVVTLDPIESDFDEPIDLIFAPPSQIRDLADSVDEDIESEEETPDPPEPIDNGFIDLGKLATDAVFLGLDPYPRKPDAVFQPLIEPTAPEEHPFAALKSLQLDPGQAAGKKPKSD
jgi:hypothetical protein